MIINGMQSPQRTTLFEELAYGDPFMVPDDETLYLKCRPEKFHAGPGPEEKFLAVDLSDGFVYSLFADQLVIRVNAEVDILGFFQ